MVFGYEITDNKVDNWKDKSYLCRKQTKKQPNIFASRRQHYCQNWLKGLIGFRVRKVN